MTVLASKRSALGLVLMASAATWTGCETGELLDNPSDASFGGNTGGNANGNNGNGNSGGTNDGTNGTEQPSNETGGGNPDGGVTGPDGGVAWDVELGSECVETFVYDPGDRTDVTSVALAGGAPFTWGATPSQGGIALTEMGGKWEIRVRMDSATVAYKFVVNETEWIADPTPARCQQEDDGFGGKNTLRYACQTQPPCGDPNPDGGAGDASIEPDDGGTFNLGDDCVETLTYDPGSRTDVTSVVIAGGAPFAWSASVAGGAIPMTKDGDVWSAKISLDSVTIPYKLVINGTEWIADPNPDMCNVVDDGFGGVNTELYACQTAPACGGDGGTSTDGGVADAGSSMDAAVTDAGVADGGAADGGSTVPVIDPSCSCVRTVWVDLDGRGDVFQDDIREVVIAGGDGAFGGWDPPFSAVMLQNAGSGVWFARVAPPATKTEYKVVVRHKNHGDAWMLDQGNCFPESNTNSALYACGSEPAACTPTSPGVALPGTQVDLCSTCSVTVTIPIAVSTEITNATNVALRGERSPLSWDNDTNMTKGATDYTSTFNVPRGRWEYQLRLNNADWQKDPANCNVTANNANNFLYGCYTAPACN